MSLRPGRRHAAALSAVALLAACAGGPLPPDWQLEAKGAIDNAVSDQLSGDSRSAEQAMARARAAVARTGQTALMARIELMRCAADTASLDFAPCAGYERWAADADAAERAYADHLAGRALTREAIALLPESQRGTAAAIAARGASSAKVQAIDEPLSRLVAIALLFRAGLADPPTIALAADTASAQGWRRPLLAWLGVMLLRAEQAGDPEESRRLRRRIELVAGRVG